jgi:aryl-alcohol dehydrogenase-like predicted oxidoreductase
MNLGTQWTGLFAGKTLDLDGACKYLDTYYDSGGNWVDVASNYQDGQSEYIVGEWMKRRGNRDDMVISTKYTSNYMIRKEGFYQGIGINYTGNQKKSLMLSVRA